MQNSGEPFDSYNEGGKGNLFGAFATNILVNKDWNGVKNILWKALIIDDFSSEGMEAILTQQTSPTHTGSCALKEPKWVSHRGRQIYRQPPRSKPVEKKLVGLPTTMPRRRRAILTSVHPS